jgi:general secretion pathway protein I
MTRSRSGLRGGRHARGFTLLEVLVAFALLAIALTLLLGTLSGAARQVGQADARTRAVLHAQSLLTSVGIESPLQEGRQQGRWEQGRYQWQLQVRPYVEPRAAPATSAGSEAVAGPRLVELELQVRWTQPRAGELRWRTLRLLPPTLEASP